MCLTPLSITREIGGIKRSVHVPCGHCLECMKDRQNEFAIRSMEAFKKYGSMVFFTLTYNEDSVHFTTVFDDECEMDETTGEVFGRSVRELHRKDLINWKKRVRQAYKRRFGHDIPDFGYVICGEYGPKTHRPHYHGAFFGLSPEVVLMFKADWEYHHGFTCFKNIPRLNMDNHDHVEATSKYIAKYICKVKELEDKLVMNEDVEKPRKITSRGFGISKDFDKMQRDLLARDLFGNYDLDMLTDENGNRMTNKEVKNLINVIIRRRMYHRNGKDYKLPQYYKRKVFYVKDASGKERASTLQNLVSYALECRIREDFNRELHKVADQQGTEDYYTCVREVLAREEASRKARAEVIFETNMDCFRKSKF